MKILRKQFNINDTKENKVFINEEFLNTESSVKARIESEVLKLAYIERILELKIAYLENVEIGDIFQYDSELFKITEAETEVRKAKVTLRIVGKRWEQ